MSLFRPQRAKPAGRQLPQRTPRGEPRFSTPCFDILIQVEVLVDGERHVGHLWDVSHSGACLRSLRPLPVDCDAGLRIHEPADRSVIETTARLLWTSRDNGSYYTGLRFLEAVPFSDTFLKILMGGSGH